MEERITNLEKAVAALSTQFGRLEKRMTAAAFIGASIVAGVFEAVMRLA